MGFWKVINTIIIPDSISSVTSILMSSPPSSDISEKQSIKFGRTFDPLG